jgi:hypothetical protein
VLVVTEGTVGWRSYLEAISTLAERDCTQGFSSQTSSFGQVVWNALACFQSLACGESVR